MLICHSLDILFLLEVKLRDRIFNFTYFFLSKMWHTYVSNKYDSMRCSAYPFQHQCLCTACAYGHVLLKGHCTHATHWHMMRCIISLQTKCLISSQKFTGT